MKKQTTEYEDRGTDESRLVAIILSTLLIFIIVLDIIPRYLMQIIILSGILIILVIYLMLLVTGKVKVKVNKVKTNDIR